MYNFQSFWCLHIVSLQPQMSLARPINDRGQGWFLAKAQQWACKGVIWAGALATEMITSCCPCLSHLMHEISIFQSFPLCYKNRRYFFFAKHNGLIQSQSLKDWSFGATCDRLGYNLHTFNCDFFDSTHLCTAHVALLQAHWCVKQPLKVMHVCMCLFSRLHLVNTQKSKLHGCMYPDHVDLRSQYRALKEANEQVVFPSGLVGVWSACSFSWVT
jgi:hypothetical protein